MIDYKFLIIISHQEVGVGGVFRHKCFPLHGCLQGLHSSFVELEDQEGGYRKADQVLTASTGKCPTVVGTSHEAQKGNQQGCEMWCLAWDQEEEEDTEAYEQQHPRCKRLPYMLSPLSHGSSILPIVLPLLSPAQSLGPRETATGWRRVMCYSPNQ